MKKRKIDNLEIPSIDLLEKELKREQYEKQYGKVLRRTIFILITGAAIKLLQALQLLPDKILN